MEHLYPVDEHTVEAKVINGGILSSSDLDKFINAYNEEKSPLSLRFRNNCEMIWSLTQNYAHLICLEL